jgi:hypothetical protein
MECSITAAGFVLPNKIINDKTGTEVNCVREMVEQQTEKWYLHFGHIGDNVITKLVTKSKVLGRKELRWRRERWRV